MLTGPLAKSNGTFPIAPASAARLTTLPNALDPSRTCSITRQWLRRRPGLAFTSECWKAARLQI